MYVGESEKNIREIFQGARENSPCILFFDELDSLAPARGSASDTSSVLSRIVSTLLTEIDALAASAMPVFVVGATNRPDLLDSALTRPGRFDKSVHVGVAKGEEEKIKIVRAATRKFTLAPGVRLEDVSRSIGEGYTGADISAVANEAYM